MDTEEFLTEGQVAEQLHQDWGHHFHFKDYIERNWRMLDGEMDLLTKLISIVEISDIELGGKDLQQLVQQGSRQLQSDLESIDTALEDASAQASNLRATILRAACIKDSEEVVALKADVERLQNRNRMLEHQNNHIHKSARDDREAFIKLGVPCTEALQEFRDKYNASEAEKVSMQKEIADLKLQLAQSADNSLLPATMQYVQDAIYQLAQRIAAACTFKVKASENSTKAD